MVGFGMEKMYDFQMFRYLDILFRPRSVDRILRPCNPKMLSQCVESEDIHHLSELHPLNKLDP